MKIIRIETWASTRVGFVRIETDSRHEGWGQLSPFNADLTAELLHRLLARRTLGTDPIDHEQLIEDLERHNHKFIGTFLYRALCGIDGALWDLRGKLEGKAVCELLGGTPDPMPVYASSMDRKRDAKGVVETLKPWRDACGARAFKIKIMQVNGRDVDVWPGRSEDLLQAMGTEFHDAALLIADANGGYSPDKAIEKSRLLRDCGFSLFEEPCHCQDIPGTARVNVEGVAPVCAGEQDYDLVRWQMIFDANAVAVAQPDLCYTGGLTRCLKIARMAEKAGIPVMPHASNRSMAMLYAMHLMRAIPNAADFLECGIEGDSGPGAPLEPPLRMVDGRVAFPEGPGWGIQVNPDALETFRRDHYRESRQA